MNYSKHKKTQADWEEIERAFMIGRITGNHLAEKQVRLSESEIEARIYMYTRRLEHQQKVIKITKSVEYVEAYIRRLTYYISHYEGMLSDTHQDR